MFYVDHLIFVYRPIICRNTSSVSWFWDIREKNVLIMVFYYNDAFRVRS